MTRWRNPSILPLFDAGPFGAAHRLTFDGGVPEPAKLADVLADFLNRLHNIVHVSPAAKEDVVRQPDGLLVGRPLRDGAVIQFLQVKRCGAPPAQSREVIRVNREQRALINRLVEQAITRNAFRLERAQERRPGNPVEVLRKILEDVLVTGKTSVARVTLQETQPRRPAEALFEVVHVGPANLVLTGQALELSCQDCGLEFRHPVVQADEAVAELVRLAGAPAVGKSLRALVQLEVAGNDGTAFAARHQLARLEAERAQVAGCTRPLVAPLAAV